METPSYTSSTNWIVRVETSTIRQDVQHLTASGRGVPFCVQARAGRIGRQKPRPLTLLQLAVAVRGPTVSGKDRRSGANNPKWAMLLPHHGPQPAGAVPVVDPPGQMRQDEARPAKKMQPRCGLRLSDEFQPAGPRPSAPKLALRNTRSGSARSWPRSNWP
jgi:hypothetical protein